MIATTTTTTTTATATRTVTLNRKVATAVLPPSEAFSLTDNTPAGVNPGSSLNCPNSNARATSEASRSSSSSSSVSSSSKNTVNAGTIHLVTPRPPITWSNFHSEIRWFNLGVVTLTPLAALYGIMTTDMNRATLWFSAFLWAYNMLGMFMFFVFFHSCGVFFCLVRMRYDT